MWIRTVRIKQNNFIQQIFNKSIQGLSLEEENYCFHRFLNKVLK